MPRASNRATRSTPGRPGPRRRCPPRLRLGDAGRRPFGRLDDRRHQDRPERRQPGRPGLLAGEAIAVGSGHRRRRGQAAAGRTAAALLRAGRVEQRAFVDDQALEPGSQLRRPAVRVDQRARPRGCAWRSPAPSSHRSHRAPRGPRPRRCIPPPRPPARCGRHSRCRPLATRAAGTAGSYAVARVERLDHRLDRSRARRSLIAEPGRRTAGSLDADHQATPRRAPSRRNRAHARAT